MKSKSYTFNTHDEKISYWNRIVTRALQKYKRIVIFYDEDDGVEIETFEVKLNYSRSQRIKKEEEPELYKMFENRFIHNLLDPIERLGIIKYYTTKHFEIVVEFKSFSELWQDYLLKIDIEKYYK